MRNASGGIMRRLRALSSPSLSFLPNPFRPFSPDLSLLIPPSVVNCPFLTPRSARAALSSMCINAHFYDDIKYDYAAYSPSLATVFPSYSSSSFSYSLDSRTFRRVFSSRSASTTVTITSAFMDDRGDLKRIRTMHFG